MLVYFLYFIFIYLIYHFLWVTSALWSEVWLLYRLNRIIHVIQVHVTLKLCINLQTVRSDIFCYNQRCGNKTQNLDFQNKTYFGKHMLHARWIHLKVRARMDDGGRRREPSGNIRGSDKMRNQKQIIAQLLMAGRIHDFLFQQKITYLEFDTRNGFSLYNYFFCCK